MNFNDDYRLNEPEEPDALPSAEETVPPKKKLPAMIIARLNSRKVLLAVSVVLIGGAVAMNALLADGRGGDSAAGGTVIDYTAGDAGDASYVGVLSEEDMEQALADEEDSDYFASALISRQRARDEAVEVLQLVIDSEDALEELKADAADGIARIAACIEQEANIESLVCAKGFAQCVAVINDNSASVIVRSPGLLPNEIVQIKEIVYEQSGIAPGAIKIIEMGE